MMAIIAWFKGFQVAEIGFQAFIFRLVSYFSQILFEFRRNKN